MKNYVTCLGIALTVALPQAAQAQGITPSVPEEVPAPDVALLLCRGFGTQNYECQSVNSLGRVRWVLFTPQAPVAAEQEASADSVLKLNVIPDPLTLWPVNGGRPATGPAIRSDRSVQAARSNRSGGRARSKTRIIAGAIAGGIGGFFGGGFLGAHIEGDRCDCDDPGVRGFLIGAPIGAVAGAIVGGKFVF